MSREKRSDEKFCSECGEVIMLKAEICPKCGCRQASGNHVHSETTIRIVNSGKSRTTAGLLALLLGGLGLHKFYLDKPLQGLFYLVFCWTFIPALLALVDAIRYFMMTDSEFQARLEQGKLDYLGGSYEPSGPTADTHVKCPDCRALIPKEARICQHCNCKLVPQ